ADSIKKGAELAVNALKVVIVCGYEAAYFKAGNNIHKLAEVLQAPVASTVGGKGIIASDDPLNIGVIGSYGMSVTNKVVHDADLVIAIGCQLSDQNTHGWTAIRNEQTILQIDRNLDDVGKSYLNTVPLIGDLKSTVSALLEEIERRHVERDRSYLLEAASAMNQWREEARHVAESNSNPIRVERVIQEMCKALPP